MQTPSKSKVLMARIALIAMIAFIVGGVVWFGVSADVRQRLWQNLLDRPGGPMTFRFFLQPTMAAVAALYDGISDARHGRSFFLWTILTDPDQRSGRLQEGLISTGRIILLGLGMDIVYQFIVFDTFHPVEAVVIALLLAFVPYLLLRGPVARVAIWWRRPLRNVP